MFLWLLFLGLLLLPIGLSLVYFIRSVHRFSWINALSRGKRKLSWLLSALLVLLPAAVFALLWGAINAVVILLHLVLFWLLFSGLQRGIARLRKRSFSRNYAAALAVVVTVAYLAVGWAQAYRVRQTDYTIQTEKPVGSLRIALLADSHVGTTFDGDGLAAHLRKLQAQDPDVIVVAGDFVDEDTTRADMIAACRSLGTLKAPYGVYFVFGNHDKGNYAQGRRGFTAYDLMRELEKNGVTILQDETVPLGDHFCLIGRQDASEEDYGSGRKSMAELTQGLDENRFTIVLDHQPHDYAAQEAASVDLVLSGHTHGGQLIPLVQLIDWFHLGGDDQVYGLEQRGNTRFLVTSGISDWAIRFKTGCFSEYVIIDVAGK